MIFTYAILVVVFKENEMNKSIVGILLVVMLSGCSGLSTRQKNAATGAAIGGVAGAVLTGGSSFGTVGGAAIGGVIGHGVDSVSKRK
ncbi:osmotically inducible lipoprotein OsmB [Methylobacillus rhizosphaerae]|uniref:Type IV secretion system putative lipoprotein virB7 n=2 Tax=Methylobacillus rhizosphaerae TaxID=551994 RepID=A0A239ADP4_9PROT|nr:osmotically inducible lipoprotein OsmB [Methylobacillus rhizosphaerae]